MDNKEIRIALAGNPNSGKTTLFNLLTGSNQFVGNWPGVTVEKKEGKLKKHENVKVTDLPGIYSLSPYTPEEIVSRNYLIDEKPDAILNIVDGTNLERNLYLTTQLAELAVPMVVCINMVDVVRKNGDKIDIDTLSGKIGCPVVEISALKGTGIWEAVDKIMETIKFKTAKPKHKFSDSVENVLDRIEKTVLQNIPTEQRRWHSVKIFERDKIEISKLNIHKNILEELENDILKCEKEMDDDSESIITNERYTYISSVLRQCYKKKNKNRISTSDKIDKIVTNRWLGLPIFAVIMFLVYFISMVGIGQWATDFANDGLFGDGFHLFGIGTKQYEEAAEIYGDSGEIIDAFVAGYGNEDISGALDIESGNYSEEGAKKSLDDLFALVPEDASVTYETQDEETLSTEEHTAIKEDLNGAISNYLNKDYKENYGEPDTTAYGVWVKGVPVLISEGFEKIGAASWLEGLVVDGIVAGVGAVLGFVPQMLVLFLLLAFLESCGYMARIAFVLDRIFRRFGLSGKSFIPMLIGSGCGVPGIMASRTIENEKDRRMTIMTTTFIPCGAKLPFISMIAGAIFGGSPWIATSSYFIGVAAIIISGIILKKTKMFSSEASPFVMELPQYHLPTVSNVLRSMWERGWSFIKKAGTIILLSTIVVWFTTYFGVVDGSFRMLEESELDSSILAKIGGAIAWLFAPLGWGTWQGAVASVTGLVAKENIVGTMGILFGAEGNTYVSIANAFTKVSGLSFLIFNLLCAPCFAAIGAIKREMNSAKWTWFAIGYQCAFAYIIAFIVNQLGRTFTGNISVVGFIFAIIVLLFLIFMIIRPDKIKKSKLL